MYFVTFRCYPILIAINTTLVIYIYPSASVAQHAHRAAPPSIRRRPAPSSFSVHHCLIFQVFYSNPFNSLVGNRLFKKNRGRCRGHDLALYHFTLTYY